MRFLGLAGTIAYYDSLRSLLNTDMPIDRAVTLAGERGAQPYRNWTPTISTACASGNHLAVGLREAGEDAFIVALIQAGETSSRLPEMCAEIVAIHRHALLLRNEIISRSIYPVILLHAATMIPAVPPLFLGQASPISLFYGPIIIWSLAVSFFILQQITRKSGLGSSLIDLPGIKALIEPFVLSNTLRVLAACGTAGLLWPDALQTAADASGNRVYAARLRNAAEELRTQRRDNLPDALGSVTQNRVVLELLNVGNVSGELEQKLNAAATLQAETFQSRARWTAKTLLGILYGIALVLAALQIIHQFMQLYGPVLEEL
jgi:type II secretory pathway component PulF